MVWCIDTPNDLFDILVYLYFVEFDESPSQENFLEVLADNHDIVIPTKPTKPVTLQHATKKGRKRKDMTIHQSEFVFHPNLSKKYLYLLGHYEQLGKTVVNFLQAGLLAKKLDHRLVVPFVRNSRFCGLRSGWIGNLRRKSREFLPIDNYFQLPSVENLFQQNNFSSLVQFDEFKKNCPTSTMIYFIYSGSRAESQRYFKLTNEEYHTLEKNLSKNFGFTNCENIEEKLNSGQRIGKVNFDKVICVNAEKIYKIHQLKSLIKNDKCVTFFLWRGVGFQRTHFNLTLPFSYDYYLSKIDFSNSILNEAERFVKIDMHNNPFIGIQIRSERQLSWYNFHKFKHCLDIVVRVATIFIYKKKIKHIFISSDLERHGSDQMSILMNTTSLQKARNYLKDSFKKLSPHYFVPDKGQGLIHNDAGYVALSQLEILSRASHLITLGAGTFQNWVKARFKRNKTQKTFENPWSITRVCSVELKNANDQKKFAVNKIKAKKDKTG